MSALSKSGQRRMKTIGLIGGMSWESTVPYYRTINRVVGERLGGLHSARLLLHSVDFDDIERLQHAARWEEAGEILVAAARGLQSIGAEFLVLCTNTMHKVAPSIEAAVTIPLLHIADATGDRIASAGLAKVGLLGTRFTMEEDFYCARLEDRYGLEVIVPPEQERAAVHRVIYEELCRGEVRESSREDYRGITEALICDGATGIILGCTEIGMLLGAQDVRVPLFDTAQIHAEQAALYALDES